MNETIRLLKEATLALTCCRGDAIASRGKNVAGLEDMTVKVEPLLTEFEDAVSRGEKFTAERALLMEIQRYIQHAYEHDAAYFGKDITKSTYKDNGERLTDQTFIRSSELLKRISSTIDGVMRPAPAKQETPTSRPDNGIPAEVKEAVTKQLDSILIGEIDDKIRKQFLVDWPTMTAKRFSKWYADNCIDNYTSRRAAPATELVAIIKTVRKDWPGYNAISKQIKSFDK